jgi:hypothetical protein
MIWATLLVFELALDLLYFLTPHIRSYENQTKSNRFYVFDYSSFRLFRTKYFGGSCPVGLQDPPSPLSNRATSEFPPERHLRLWPSNTKFPVLIMDKEPVSSHSTRS